MTIWCVLTSDTAPGTAASKAKAADAKSCSFMIPVMVVLILQSSLLDDLWAQIMVQLWGEVQSRICFERELLLFELWHKRYSFLDLGSKCIIPLWKATMELKATRQNTSPLQLTRGLLWCRGNSFTELWAKAKPGTQWGLNFSSTTRV